MKFVKKNIILIFGLLVFVALFYYAYPAILGQIYDYLIREGMKSEAEGNYLDCERYYKYALELKPNDPEVNTRLGYFYFRRRKFNLAIRFFNSAAKATDNPEIQYMRGETFLHLGKMTLAKNAFRLALNYNPSCHKARRELAGLLFKEGNKGEAIELLEETTVKKPEDPEAVMQLYGYLIQAGELQEAVRTLEKSLDMKKPPEEVFNKLFAYYREHNDRKKIEALLGTLMEKYPASPNIYYSVSLYYESKSLLKQAEKVLLECKKKNPDSIYSYIMLSEFYNRHERHKEAVATAKEALAINPNCEHIYFLLGNSYYELGDYKNAEIELKRCLSIVSKNPIALNSLAWLYLSAPPGEFYRPAEALKYAKKAISIEPEEPALIDTLARAYYANGNYNEAIINYRANITGKHNLNYAYYGIATCFFRLGDEKSARIALKEAIKLGFKDKKLIEHDLDIPAIKKAFTPYFPFQKKASLRRN